jgi:hypothetical protein
MRFDAFVAVAFVLAVAGLGGCDARVPVDASRKICDGSEGLRFAYQLRGGFLTPRPYDLFYEPGVRFLFIDGRCHFWVSPVDLSEAPFHEGVLDAALEARVTSATHFQSWASLVGPYACTDDPPTDAGDAIFEDGTQRVTCSPCPTDAPAELAETCDAPDDLERDLWALSTPMDGPVRIYLNDGDVARDDEVAWPLARDLDEVVAATVEWPLVIADAADADALRALKRKHDADFPDLAGAVPVRGANDRHFLLHVRDVLPFEDPMTGQVDF